MRTKGVIGLLAVTVVAVIVAIVVVKRGNGAPPVDPLAGTPVLPEVGKRLGDVGQLAMVRGGVKTTLLRKGDGWVMEEKGGYAADDVKVRQALLGLGELSFVEPKTRKADLYARLELEDPDKAGAKSTLVTVTDGKGSLLGEVITGKRRVDQLGGGTDGIYVRKPGDAQSWLARGTLDLSATPPQWLQTKIVDLPAGKMKDVVLTGADGVKLTLHRDKPEDKFTLAEMPADKKLKSETALDDPAGALGGLELTDVQPAKDFEFPKDGVTHAVFTGFDGVVVTADLVDKDGTSWLKLAAGGTGDAEKPAADLNAKLSPWVYGVASYKAKALQTKLADLLETPKGS